MSAPLQIFHPTYARLLCLHIRRRGVSLAAALAGTGMTWRQLLHEKRLMAFDPMRRLILAAQRLTGCPSLGLEFGMSAEIASHGLMGAVMAPSRDVSQALRAAARYRPLRSRSVAYELAALDDRSTLILREAFDFDDVRTFILEAHVGSIERMMTTVAGESSADIEYLFPYAPPGWASEYSRLLAGTVRFGAARMEIRVPERVLRLPGVLAEAGARAAAVLSAERELVLQRRGVDLGRQILLLLLEHQGFYPSVKAMAQELSMSPRTLLRKLRQEGVTYQTLLDDARKEVAEWYLLRTREPIEAIAGRLGYADASNFSRTFRRWFGEPPGKFRSDRRDTRERS